MPANPVAKTWCFTINNYRETIDMENILGYYDNTRVTRITIGREVGENNTPHLQGCITFKKATRFKSFKAKLAELTGKQPHIERAHNVDASHTYCKKDGNFEEADFREQGKRSDLDDACQTLQESGLRAVAQLHPTSFVRYATGFTKLRNILVEAYTGKPYVIWAYGPTGTGKSRDARERYPSAIRITSTNGRFFGLYSGEKQVIFDDFRGSLCTWSCLLNLLDFGAMSVEVKGGDVPWAADTIVITSALSPSEIYPNVTEDRQQLIRRLDKIYYYNILGYIEDKTGDF